MLFKQISERIGVFRRARSVIEDDTEYTQVCEYRLNEQRQSNAKILIIEDTQGFFRRARSVIEDDTEHTQVYEYRLSEQRQSNAKKEQVYGGLAQLGERLLCTQEVKSSILLISTNPRNAEECTLTTE